MDRFYENNNIKAIVNTTFAIAKILCFTSREAQEGPVYCNGLGLNFPILYRATVVTTNQHLKQACIDSNREFTPGVWFSFELTKIDNSQFIGDVTWDEVSYTHRNGQKESIVIRYHKNYDVASSYLRGYVDTLLSISRESFPFDTCGLYKTDQGYFTNINIPTPDEWDDPLIFYLAEVPDEPFEWAHIIGPDGSPRNPSDFGY